MKISRSKKQFGSKRILGRYALLQLPGIIMLSLILIALFVGEAISAGFLWLILLVWIGKDIALYPFVWRAYDPDHKSKKYSMIGLKGVASEYLNPSGYINVQGELWFAQTERDNRSIEAGESVEIIKIEGMTLIVKPGGN